MQRRCGTSALGSFYCQHSDCYLIVPDSQEFHDREGIARRRGPDADARLFVELRPWAGREAVLICIADPTDPHPAWLVTTRHPDRLQAVIAATMDTDKGELP
jgi:hypothetical protein